MKSKLQSLVAETPRKSHWLSLEMNTMLSHCICNHRFRKTLQKF
ncbi:hypothetical protein C5167_028917 [Papaver somniferum]|nr:hypothetical protein C5167_028917 [Papaver somniferum]